ncbi:MAG: hypothetical protein SXV54_23960 [Chloroflexota bacterium]|nr:hypothetical protein [Chloroflexota bacterium]
MNKMKHILLWGVLVAVGILGVISMTQTFAGPHSQVQTPVAKLPPPNPRVPREKIIKGTVIEVEESYVMITSSRGSLVTLHISPETRIWKGKWDSDLPIKVGDFFYGYGEPNKDGTVYEMEQMEINIVNLRGVVVSVKEVSGGLDVQLDEVHEGKSYLVHITSETLVISNEGQEVPQDVPFGEAQFDLEAGYDVQIIGLKLEDGSVVATRVF